MRTIQMIVVVALLSLSASPALADVAGVYEVKFEEVSTNCTIHKLAYKPQHLTIKVKGNSLTIDIDRTPLMAGIPQKNGKVSAKSKLGATMIDGMKGVFSVAGRITPEGMLSLVMVGEYSADGKAICTQSWNVSGPKAEKPAKKSATEPSLLDYFDAMSRLGW